MDTPVLFHNPRCSKSRKALSLLQEHEAGPIVVEYLLDPPSADAVLELIRKSGGNAGDFVRRKEAAYAESGLSANSSVNEIAEAIAQRPSLLERPVLVVGERAVIGRPPERVLELLKPEK